MKSTPLTSETEEPRTKKPGVSGYGSVPARLREENKSKPGRVEGNGGDLNVSGYLSSGDSSSGDSSSGYLNKKTGLSRVDLNIGYSNKTGGLSEGEPKESTLSGNFNETQVWPVLERTYESKKVWLRFQRFLNAYDIELDPIILKAAEAVGLVHYREPLPSLTPWSEVPFWFCSGRDFSRTEDLALGGLLLSVGKGISRLSSSHERAASACKEGFSSIYQHYFPDRKHPFWIVCRSLDATTDSSLEWAEQTRHRKQKSYTASDISRRGEVHLDSAICPTALAFMCGRPEMVAAVREFVLSLSCGIQLLDDYKKVEHSLRENLYTPLVVDLMLKNRDRSQVGSELGEPQEPHEPEATILKLSNKDNNTREAILKNFNRALLNFYRCEIYCRELPIKKALPTVQRFLLNVSREIIRLSVVENDHELKAPSSLTS